MKIPLSDPLTSKAEPVFRAIESTKFSFLMLSLLSEESSVQYRKIATQLRAEISPIQGGQGTYECVHPEWFDEGKGAIVDSTSCNFCAYAHYCTMGKDNRETVEIVPLKGTRSPGINTIARLFDFNGEADEHIPNDPFVGFSHRAGQSRTLYLIEMTKLQERFPTITLLDVPLENAVGYDRLSQQPIWPVDQLFLEEYERQNKNVLLKFEDIPYPPLSDLNAVDRRLVEHVAAKNNWLREQDSPKMKNGLYRFLLGIGDFLKHSSTFTGLHSQGYASMSPRVEHPYPLGGTGFLIFALRWMELKPNDFRDLAKDQTKSYGLDFDISRLPHGKSFSQHGATQYVPRLPAIALVPTKPLHEVNLELPAVKIIDVHQYRGKNTLLIIDGLGLDLLEELEYEIQ